MVLTDMIWMTSGTKHTDTAQKLVKICGRIIAPLLDSIFPTYCLKCGRRVVGDDPAALPLCSTCLHDLPRALPESDYYRAVDRLSGIVPFVEYQSDLIYSHYNASRLLLHEIKYHGRPEIAYHLTRDFSRVHREKGHFDDVSLILPIPLDKRRLCQRGYNQSEYIARGLSDGLGVPVVTDLLARHRSSGTQTKRTKTDRWDKLDGLFYLRDTEALKAKRVLICDDLLTSGSTLLHAARALIALESPPESISFYTLFLNFLP